MKKFILLIFFFFFKTVSFAQVGINTTNPEAQLEIKSSNQALPSNTDGLLIPKIDTFPATNPTVAQQGMLVYLTTAVGVNQPGFYFWENTTTNWKPITGATSAGTLDQAYDFGGAGLGKTITADAGAVLIDGTDGFVSTGSLNMGAVTPSGAGNKMFWNPRKAAFRSGLVSGTQWDNTNVGYYSTAFGLHTIASQTSSTAFGSSTTASGIVSTAFGSYTIASGFVSTAFGRYTTASGYGSTTFGSNTVASATYSSAFGDRNTAFSYGETVFGIGATNYTPSTDGQIQFATANATDRLFVIGNAIDANTNGNVDSTERSDAMIVLKNGLTRLPSTTNAMITVADGKAVVTKEYLQSTISGGTLDQAYDFGGAGLGKTITADAGAVLINGTDGLVSTGTFGAGAIAPAGVGTKMFWNPRKAAFRAGQVEGFFSPVWDDVNIGNNSVAFGKNIRVSGDYSAAFGEAMVVSGTHSVAFGNSHNIRGNQNTAFGVGNDIGLFAEISFAAGISNHIFGQRSIALGSYNVVNEPYAVAIGDGNIVYGLGSHAYGNSNKVTGDLGVAIGYRNSSRSFGEIAIGIGCTEYTPSTNGATEFEPANATDRIFVIGNGIDTNNDNDLDDVERSDAMIVLKNGLTRLPSTTNAMITAADGKAVVTKEYLEQNGSWGVAGNVGTNTSNFIGTTDLQPFSIRTNDVVRARILATGEVGIGTTIPDRKLEVLGSGNQFMRISTSGTSDAGIEFKRTGSGIDWQMRNDGGDLIFGQSTDDLLTVEDVVRISTSTFTPVNNSTIQLGALTRKWTAVYATNGVIQTSDANDKKEILPLNYGLDKIKSLRPISFQWKNDNIDKSSTHLGFVAQEVQQVLPEIVVDHEWKEIPDSAEKVWEKTDKLGMKYSEIIPVLVKAMQEQQSQIEELKAKIEKLENK